MQIHFFVPCFILELLMKLFYMFTSSLVTIVYFCFQLSGPANTHCLETPEKPMKLVFNPYMYFKINIPYHERSMMPKSKKSQTKSMKNVYHSYKISKADTEINHLWNFMSIFQFSKI